MATARNIKNPSGFAFQVRDEGFPRALLLSKFAMKDFHVPLCFTSSQRVNVVGFTKVRLRKISTDFQVPLCFTNSTREARFGW
jgi:hypothetical protein